jgi:GTPase-activator protein for Ras-like GTPase
MKRSGSPWFQLSYFTWLAFFVTFFHFFFFCDEISQKESKKKLFFPLGRKMLEVKRRMRQFEEDHDVSFQRVVSRIMVEKSLLRRARTKQFRRSSAFFNDLLTLVGTESSSSSSSSSASSKLLDPIHAHLSSYDLVAGERRECMSIFVLACQYAATLSGAPLKKLKTRRLRHHLEGVVKQLDSFQQAHSPDFLLALVLPWWLPQFVALLGFAATCPDELVNNNNNNNNNNANANNDDGSSDSSSSVAAEAGGSANNGNNSAASELAEQDDEDGSENEFAWLFRRCVRTFHHNTAMALYLMCGAFYDDSAPQKKFLQRVDKDASARHADDAQLGEMHGAFDALKVASRRHTQRIQQALVDAYAEMPPTNELRAQLELQAERARPPPVIASRVGRLPTLDAMEEIPALKRLLLEPPYALASALGKLSLKANQPNERLFKAIVSYFGAYSQLLPLLELTITQEILQTTVSTTLFRGESFATKLLSAYFFGAQGKAYLKRTVLPLIQELCSVDVDLEIDPGKADKGVDTAANMDRLCATSQNFLNIIFNSAPHCPATFRRVFCHAQREVSKKFPEMKQLVVGGFLFLRFFCPAIVSPHKYGLVDGAPGANATRALILVSKLLQNIANGVEFDGSKEAYLKALNRIVTRNIGAVRTFFDHLADDGLYSGHRFAPSTSTSTPSSTTRVSAAQSRSTGAVSAAAAAFADSISPEMRLAAFLELASEAHDNQSKVDAMLDDFVGLRRQYTRYMLSREPSIVKSILADGGQYCDTVGALIERLPNSACTGLLGIDKLDRTFSFKVVDQSRQKQIDMLVEFVPSRRAAVRHFVGRVLALHDAVSHLYRLWPRHNLECLADADRAFAIAHLALVHHLVDAIFRGAIEYVAPAQHAAWLNFRSFFQRVLFFVSAHLHRYPSRARLALSLGIVQLRYTLTRLLELHSTEHALPL